MVIFHVLILTNHIYFNFYLIYSLSVFYRLNYFKHFLVNFNLFKCFYFLFCNKIYYFNTIL